VRPRRLAGGLERPSRGGAEDHVRGEARLARGHRPVPEELGGDGDNRVGIEAVFRRLEPFALGMELAHPCRLHSRIEVAERVLAGAPLPAHRAGGGAVDHRRGEVPVPPAVAPRRLAFDHRLRPALSEDRRPAIVELHQHLSDRAPADPSGERIRVPEVPCEHPLHQIDLPRLAPETVAPEFAERVPPQPVARIDRGVREVDAALPLAVVHVGEAFPRRFRGEVAVVVPADVYAEARVRAEEQVTRDIDLVDQTGPAPRGAVVGEKDQVGAVPELLSIQLRGDRGDGAVERAERPPAAPELRPGAFMARAVDAGEPEVHQTRVGLDDKVEAVAEVDLVGVVGGPVHPERRHDCGAVDLVAVRGREGEDRRDGAVVLHPGAADVILEERDLLFPVGGVPRPAPRGQCAEPPLQRRAERAQPRGTHPVRRNGRPERLEVGAARAPPPVEPVVALDARAVREHPGVHRAVAREGTRGEAGEGAGEIGPAIEEDLLDRREVSGEGHLAQDVVAEAVHVEDDHIGVLHRAPLGEVDGAVDDVVGLRRRPPGSPAGVDPRRESARIVGDVEVVDTEVQPSGGRRRHPALAADQERSAVGADPSDERVARGGPALRGGERKRPVLHRRFVQVGPLRPDEPLESVPPRAPRVGYLHLSAGLDAERLPLREIDTRVGPGPVPGHLHRCGKRRNRTEGEENRAERRARRVPTRAFHRGLRNAVILSRAGRGGTRSPPSDSASSVPAPPPRGLSRGRAPHTPARRWASRPV